MRPSRHILLPIFGALLLVGLAVLVWPRENEPTYQGRSMTDWLSIYENAKLPGASDSDIQERDNAKTAVRAMGTNVVPILLRWINHKLPPWRQKVLATYYQRWANQGGWDYTAYAMIVGRGEIHAELAVDGFEILGGEARQAVPELARRMNAGDSRAAVALAMIGEDALQPLMALLGDQNATNRVCAAIGIGAMTSIGTNTNAVVTLLIKSLKDTDKRVARSAARALGRLTLEPEIAVPALIDSLTTGDQRIRASVVFALSQFKEHARSAVPVLITTLTDPAEYMRDAATNALLNIAPEVLGRTNAPSETADAVGHNH